METTEQPKPEYNFDFIKYRRIAVFGSLAINLAVLFGLGFMGLNMGVDFAGGSEMSVKFGSNVDAEKVRKAKYDIDESEVKPYFQLSR